MSGSPNADFIYEGLEIDAIWQLSPHISLTLTIDGVSDKPADVLAA